MGMFTELPVHGYGRPFRALLQRPLFLTTNWVDDIDEAIVSRCIAMIKYHPPQADDRRRIWQVMASQLQLALDGALIEELVMCFPQASGRDIKELAKRVAKFCQHKQLSPTLEVFQRCSSFRGMDVQSPAS